MDAFEIAIPDAELEDLRYRLAHTRWPDDFANDDWRYGVNADYLKQLVQHWLEHYDWRARERMMNALPQFRTEINGVPVHFVHQRGKGPKPIPLILNHGWPWTFWDFHKIIGPLTDPAAHGGDPADAFDIVAPSLPGYAFSTPLRKTGVNFWNTADLWVKLMQQLGYERFGSQGGDWGSFLSAQLGHKYAERLIGVHLHTPAPLHFMSGRGYPKEDFSEDEQDKVQKMRRFAMGETGYMALQQTKPQTPAVGLNDSPAGLLGWIVEKRRTWSDCGGDVESRFTRDELIDTVMLYWVTQSYHSSARFYYEGAHDLWQPAHERSPCVEAPTAIAILPGEITYPPRKFAERYYNLQRWTEFPEGGHFAAMEVPELLVEDLRAFFRDKR
ncbi:epoxide hydrolase [Mangrovimicrobium sediminis]|uniref:Epoxide hydrolase n=1 Tax=Mangrovimicrobium sediminis TaxID=2562682 RepID=A0A4Z0M9N8_9GAMM|nr:epoxide hydrolase family protein [Haliea sp. SAOS-164]TGD76229.1 epoxide hydrolase [Haliea sp. SAOS-164]